MTTPPVTGMSASTPNADLSAALAALRIAVAELSPAGGEAHRPAPAHAGERRDKTAADRKARWMRRREEGACWISCEIDADLLDVLVAAGELPEAERHNRASIAAALLALAAEGLRARYGTVVSFPTSLTRPGTRSAK